MSDGKCLVCGESVLTKPPAHCDGSTHKIVYKSTLHKRKKGSQ